jgi:ribosome-associated translation inhibitor RaiA
VSALKQIPHLVVEARGKMPRTSRAYARDKIAAVADYVREPILHARVRLTHLPDPAVARPAVAQVNLDINGRLVRAQVAAATMHEAIDELHDRLRDRIDRLNPHWEARRGGMPTAGQRGVPEWRHGSEPAHRPDYYPRPVDERQVIRHKTYALSVETVDEAVFELESMDYDFHLFTDLHTGQDSVVYRAGPTGYRLACIGAAGGAHVPSAASLTISEHHAPELQVTEAIARLELVGLPFVFFADPATGRGAVLYHRYDGHYGLITPTG